MTDRRAYFFLASAVAVILVRPLVPQFRWITLALAVLYLVFALLFVAADFSSRRRRR